MTNLVVLLGLVVCFFGVFLCYDWFVTVTQMVDSSSKISSASRLAAQILGPGDVLTVYFVFMYAMLISCNFMGTV